MCPSQAAAVAAASTGSVSCDVQLPLSLALSVRGIALGAVAMEDYDNGGPATRALRLSCFAAPGSPSALDVRAASVALEVTNIVRPIFGRADFAEGANESETRRVLSAGTRLCLLVVPSPHDVVHAR